MAIWQVRGVVRNPSFSASTDPAVARTSALAALTASLAPGWEAQRVEVDVLYTLGDWVAARRPSGTGEDYARIVLHANGVDLQVEFADGVRRGIAAVVRRV